MVSPASNDSALQNRSFSCKAIPNVLSMLDSSIAFNVVGGDGSFDLSWQASWKNWFTGRPTSWPSRAVTSSSNEGGESARSSDVSVSDLSICSDRARGLFRGR